MMQVMVTVPLLEYQALLRKAALAPTQGADARPVALTEILNNWSIEHQVFLPQEIWDDLKKRLKGAI